jgi:hypothetical protein
MKKTLLTIALLASPLFASAQTTTATSTTAVTSQTKIVCAQTAVEKRDAAIIAGHNNFNTAIVSALTARKDSVKAAFALTDKTAIKEARKNSNATFSASVKNSHSAMRTLRINSWNTFKSDMKICGVENRESHHTVSSPTYSY